MFVASKTDTGRATVLWSIYLGTASNMARRTATGQFRSVSESRAFKPHE